MCTEQQTFVHAFNKYLLNALDVQWTRDPSSTRDTTTNKAGSVAAHVVLVFKCGVGDRKGAHEYTNH